MFQPTSRNKSVFLLPSLLLSQREPSEKGNQIMCPGRGAGKGKGTDAGGRSRSPAGARLCVPGAHTEPDKVRALATCSRGKGRAQESQWNDFILFLSYVLIYRFERERWTRARRSTHPRIHWLYPARALPGARTHSPRSLGRHSNQLSPRAGAQGSNFNLKQNCI